MLEQGSMKRIGEGGGLASSAAGHTMAAERPQEGWNRVYMEEAFDIYTVKGRGLKHTILVSF